MIEDLTLLSHGFQSLIDNASEAHSLELRPVRYDASPDGAEDVSACGFADYHEWTIYARGEDGAKALSDSATCGTACSTLALINKTLRLPVSFGADECGWFNEGQAPGTLEALIRGRIAHNASHGQMSPDLLMLARCLSDANNPLPEQSYRVQYARKLRTHPWSGWTDAKYVFGCAADSKAHATRRFLLQARRKGVEDRVHVSDVSLA